MTSRRSAPTLSNRTPYLLGPISKCIPPEWNFFAVGVAAVSEQISPLLFWNVFTHSNRLAKDWHCTVFCALVPGIYIEQKSSVMYVIWLYISLKVHAYTLALVSWNA